MKLSHFGYSLLDIWSAVVDSNESLNSEQEEKNMYAINYSAHCPTNLNEKLISLYSRNVIGKGMKRVLVLRDTLTPILFYILEFEMRSRKFSFKLWVSDSKTFSPKVLRLSCVFAS